MRPLDFIWASMASVYGTKWTAHRSETPGTVDSAAWGHAVDDVSMEALTAALHACMTVHPDWPPTLPEFRALCLGIPSVETVLAELEGRPTGQSPFTRMVWGKLDRYRMRTATADQAEGMVRRVYEATRQAVMEGERMPEPSLAIEHGPAAPKKTDIPNTRAGRIAHLRYVLGDEFNDAAASAYLDARGDVRDAPP